jgi:hypothetical protein
MSLPNTKEFLQRRGLLLAVLLAAIVVVGVLSYAVNSEQVETAPELEAPPTYMGSLACKECHEGIYRGWQTTFHAKKFQLTNADFILGDFERDNKITAGGNTTVMSREGEDFFVTTLGPDNKEEAYRIKYVIGSIWKQRYVTEFPNGGLYVLPVQWNVLTEEWADYYGLATQKPGAATTGATARGCSSTSAWDAIPRIPRSHTTRPRTRTAPPGRKWGWRVSPATAPAAGTSPRIFPKSSKRSSILPGFPIRADPPWSAARAMTSARHRTGSTPTRRNTAPARN